MKKQTKEKQTHRFNTTMTQSEAELLQEYADLLGCGRATAMKIFLHKYLPSEIELEKKAKERRLAGQNEV